MYFINRFSNVGTHIVEDILHKADVTVNGSRKHDIKTKYYDEIMDRIVKDGELGFMDTYIEGLWECDDLVELFSRLMRVEANNKIKTWLDNLKHGLNKIINYQTLEKSKEVINIHYNIGNEWYQQMLGPTMQYSCGYWLGLEDEDSNNLDQAQLNKISLIIRKLHIQPNMRILDIGCGFGTLAYHIYRSCRDIEVIGVTLSEEQYKYCCEKYGGLGVKYLLCDYRELPEDLGKFDRIVSVGMFEHVGFKNYEVYRDIVDDHLKDDGIFLLHTIGKESKNSHQVSPFIRKYIFPNGQVPCSSDIINCFLDKFNMEDWHNFGLDYAYTLQAWYDKIKTHPKFNRIWKLYLLSCTAAFLTRKLHLWQIVFTKHKLFKPSPYRSVR